MNYEDFERLVEGEAFVDGGESEEDLSSESEDSCLGGFVVRDSDEVEEESEGDDSSVEELRVVSPGPRHKGRRLVGRESRRLLEDLRDSPSIGTQVTSGMLTPARDSALSKEDEVEECGRDCRCGERIRSVELVRVLCQEVGAEGTTGATGVLLEKYRRTFGLIREILGSPCFAESSMSAGCSARKRKGVGARRCKRYRKKVIVIDDSDEEVLLERERPGDSVAPVGGVGTVR
jgi:hypothetical protein